MARDAASVALEFRSVTRAFGSLVANRNLTFSVRSGRIHAIIGENGAGKSTAMKLAFGLLTPDSGEILAFGNRAAFKTPRDATRAGIGMVHQHFMLAAPHSGLDNVLLGAEHGDRGQGRSGFIDWLKTLVKPIDRGAARARINSLRSQYGLKVDIDKIVEAQPVGVQQRLEILKLLYRDARLLILDEPTAVLTPDETNELFRNLKELVQQGRTIVIITHKLNEVMSVADDVTVMRKGEVVATKVVRETNEVELASLMVGRSVALDWRAQHAASTKEPVLSLSDVSMAESGKRPRLSELSFDVRAGEIVAIAGVEGNGQSELLDLLTNPRSFFGSHRGLRAAGGLGILGVDARSLSALDVRSLGVGLVPEDRHRQGLVLSFDLTHNFALGLHRTEAFSRFGWLKLSAVRGRLLDAIKRFDIRPAEPTVLASSLSGGNQQKVVVARELERAPRLFICAQPTRGVDVGAIEMIHRYIVDVRDGGAGVLLISSSLDEIRALADRVIVFFEGKVAGHFSREAKVAEIGRAMSCGREANV